jgi:WhiB family transcriptional regulator, redox-sensing transcriptional regulator
MDPEPVIDRVGSWLAGAACRDRDTDDWFEGDDLGARVVCRSCPVASECLDHAIAERLDYGIWGGLRAVDRAEVARLRGIAAEVPEPPRPRRCSWASGHDGRGRCAPAASSASTGRGRADGRHPRVTAAADHVLDVRVLGLSSLRTRGAPVVG